MAAQQINARPTQSCHTDGNTLETGERTAVGPTEIIPDLWLGCWDDGLKFDGETLNLRDGEGYHSMTFYVSLLTKHPSGWTEMHHVDPKRLELAVDIVEWRMSLGKKLLVHCYFGKERSALVVAHYLVRSGMIDTLDNAYVYLKNLRPMVLDRRAWIGVAT